MIPTDHAERLNWFRQLAHVVHLGRCTRFPFGDCHRHEEAEYFTPKDNDIASVVLKWLEFGRVNRGRAQRNRQSTEDDMKAEEAIAAHRPYGLDCKCGVAINSDRSWASHLIAALAECGLAVIDLPGWDDPKYVKPADCDEDGYCVDCRSATVHREGCIVRTGKLT